MFGLSEILTTLNILEKVKRFWDWLRPGRQHPEVESIATRFVRLFENHGVHRNQIPRFFGHGLSVKDVQSDQSLLEKLDEPLLQEVCELFAVRREWLDGADKTIYEAHDFYKQPGAFGPFLSTLKTLNPEGGLDGILLAPTETNGEAILILFERVGFVGDKAIYRYHLCNNWLFEYWKARAYLTACVAIAWKNKLNVMGFYSPEENIARLSSGETFFGDSEGDAWHWGGRRWYAEDMALHPEVFLRSVDPELNNFGTRSALELWLRLDEQGFMSTGLSMYSRDKVRQDFEQALGQMAID